MDRNIDGKGSVYDKQWIEYSEGENGATGCQTSAGSTRFRIGGISRRQALFGGFATGMQRRLWRESRGVADPEAVLSCQLFPRGTVALTVIAAVE